MREGRRYFCVLAASSGRKLCPRFLVLYVLQCLLCVVVYRVRGASAFMLEYMSVDTDVAPL